MRLLLWRFIIKYDSRMNNKSAEEYAKELRLAYSQRIAIEPLREAIGVDNIDLAYDIQNANTLFRMNNGARLIGKKIGLTSEAVQTQLGVDQPDFGMLFDDMEVLNGGAVSMSELMQPKAEAEIAFVLAEDLDDDRLTVMDLIAAIDYAVPAIEIVGSRIRDWDIKITDTVADNASASHFVIGHRPRTLDEFDMVSTQMSMTKNGTVVSEGSGAACLGSPLNATLWLAKKMVELGSPLQAGELILSGAVGPMTNVVAGDKLVASFEGLGKVSISFR